MSCNFERAPCPLIQDTSDSEDWTLVNAALTESGLQMGTDHTTESGDSLMNN